MWSVLSRGHHSDDDNLALQLWEIGTAGALDEVDGLRAFFEDERAAQTFATLWPDAEIRQESAVVSFSTNPEDCDPILVGKQFCIAPPGCRAEMPSDRLHLHMDTGLGFGSGRHETTQLCLEALEQYVTPNATILDVGCGSGILSQAARLLGAQRVFCCDIHENDVSERNHFFRGSADAYRSACADLVFANITAAILDMLAFELRRVTKTEGLIVISGFLRENPPHCFSPTRILAKGDWLCWICRPADTTPLPQPAEGLSHKADWWL